MSDIGAVDDFEQPGLTIDTFIDVAIDWIEKDNDNRGLPYMNMIYAEDATARAEAVEDEQISQREAELWELAERLNLFYVLAMGSAQAVGVPEGFPVFTVFAQERDEVYAVFMKDKSLVEIIDWSY